MSSIINTLLHPLGKHRKSMMESKFSAYSPKVRRMSFTEDFHFAAIPVLAGAYIPGITFGYGEAHVGKGLGR